MEIHETYSQVWHRLSITLPMLKSGFALMLTPTFLMQTQGCGSPVALLTFRYTAIIVSGSSEFRAG